MVTLIIEKILISRLGRSMDLTLDVLEWPETLKPMFFSCWDLIMRNLLKEIMFHTTNLCQAPTISRWVLNLSNIGPLWQDSSKVCLQMLANQEKGGHTNRSMSV